MKKIKKVNNNFLYKEGAMVGDPYMMAAQKIKGSLENIGTGVNAVGNFMYQNANAPDKESNLGQSAIGMGLQGLTAGAKFGGVPGAIIGGVAGAGLGLYTAKANNIAKEEQDYMKEKAMLKNATTGIDTGYFMNGGLVKDNPLIPVAVLPIYNAISDLNKKKAKKIQQVSKFEEGGKTKEKFENTETFYSQMVRDKNNYIIPQMAGQAGDKESGVPIVHIQTEIGEKGVLPDGSIFDVKAKDKHEKMHKDKVTDVFPEGVYIAGARESSNIKKSKAEKEVLGHTPVIYNEFENNGAPEEIKLSDLFKKEKHTAAELVDMVAKKFKITNRDKDPFTEITNEENKVGRIPYLAKIIQLREASKSNKNLAKQDASEEVPVAKKGGMVKKYQEDGFTSPQLFPTAGGGIGGSLNIPDNLDDKFGGDNPESDEYQKMIQTYSDNQAKFLDKYKQQYSDYYKYARGANAAANILGMAGTALQSSQFTPAYKSNAFVNEMYAKTPQFLREQGVSEAQRPLYSVARNLSQLAVPGSSVMSMMAPSIARATDSANRTYQNYVMDDINQDRKKYMTLQGIQDYNVAQDANAENMRRRMDNYKISQIAGYGGQALTGDASLKGRQVRDLLSLEGQGIQNEFSANAQLAMLKQQQRMLDSLNKNKSVGQSSIPGVGAFSPSNVGESFKGSMQEVNRSGSGNPKYDAWRESFKRNWGHYPEEE